MTYTPLQSAYLFHRRNRGARALRAIELAKIDVEAGTRAAISGASLKGSSGGKFAGT